MTTGERIVFARTKRGLTQAQLAERSGIGAPLISRYEAGRVSPRPLALAKIADAISISFEWLKTGVGDMEEFPSNDSPGLTVDLDGAIAARLHAYATLNGLSLEEALADILDFPLSAYSPHGPIAGIRDEESRKEALRALGFDFDPATSVARHRAAHLAKHISIKKGKP